MGADELLNHMAYDMLKDEKYNKHIRKQMTGDLSKEERAQAMKEMFISLGGVNASNK